MHNNQALRAALAFLFLGSVEAFWRMQCAIIQRGRIDTLVNPGAIAAHSHSIIGGSNFGINATYDSLLNSECTSCEITADKSAYWTPTLYYNYPNGTFYEVPHDGGVAYYLGRGPNTNQTIPFPPGLNILSGDKSARSYDNQTYTWGNATYPGRPVADRISFACLKDNQPPEQPYMFDTDCPYGMRAQIHFQSCWNGVDLYKADNSHVAYQSQIDNGICPPTHPIQIPHLFLETLYSVANVPNQSSLGKFVFSQGDPTGYGMHGDFQNGWETDVLAQAVTDCLSIVNFGTIEECPILQQYRSNGYTYNCPERPRQIGEDVTGLISRLPGCITLTPGPDAAPAASMACGADVPKPSVTRTVDSVPLATTTVTPGATWGGNTFEKYVGCFNDSGSTVRTLNAATTSNYSIMTVDYCNSYCKQLGYRLSGVESGQECFCDNAVNPTAVLGTPGTLSAGCTWNCGGTMVQGGTQQICGGLTFISVYNNTDPSFVANGSNANSAGNIPKDLPIVTKPNYVGCATDNYNGSGRTLAGDALTQLNMSSTICQNYCSQGGGGNGWQYWGTEYGSQCFCGNAIRGTNFITNATSGINNGTCNTRCTGIGDEICGGANAISLYKNPSYVPPRVKSPIGKYVQKNCLTDPGGSGGRALANYTFTSTVMTADLCVKTCLGRKFRYAGVEYGTECYCGSAISRTSGATTLVCNIANLMTCPGDKTTYCGGPSLLNLYYSASVL